LSQFIAKAMNYFSDYFVLVLLISPGMGKSWAFAPLSSYFGAANWPVEAIVPCLSFIIGLPNLLA
jgi:hypothetical protein